ncbi:hypothetical protein HJFPF1_04410 [Paramyrothecium foliicola]|nr:hypothetical protein HJFPF1_04410 [Paramyrothecium foliicola]
MDVHLRKQESWHVATVASGPCVDICAILDIPFRSSAAEGGAIPGVPSKLFKTGLSTRFWK